MAVQMVYKSPNYVTQAALRKFGRRIEIMGITEDEELRLWEKISLRAINTEKPQRKCASIVDVKTVSLVNKSLAEVNSEGKEKESGDECCNEVEIGSKLGSNESSKQNTRQSYQIHLGDWSHGELGKLIKTMTATDKN